MARIGRSTRETVFTHTSVVHRVHLGRVVGHDDGWGFFLGCSGGGLKVKEVGLYVENAFVRG
jgi:hypothetical protein